MKPIDTDGQQVYYKEGMGDGDRKRGQKDIFIVNVKYMLRFTCRRAL